MRSAFLLLIPGVFLILGGVVTLNIVSVGFGFLLIALDVSTDRVIEALKTPIVIQPGSPLATSAER